jgi:hypothetical protein
VHHIQEMNGAISAGSVGYTRLFGWKLPSRNSIVCVVGWVPFGAIVVLWRGKPGSCVAVGSDPPTRVLNDVAMVVCWLGTVQSCAQN